MTFNFHWICKPSLLLEGPSLLSEKQKIFPVAQGLEAMAAFPHLLPNIICGQFLPCPLKNVFLVPWYIFKWQVLLYGWKLLRNTNAAVLRTWIHPCCLSMFHGSYLFSHIFFPWQFVWVLLKEQKSSAKYDGCRIPCRGPLKVIREI